MKLSLDTWALSILRDPLSKTPLTLKTSCLTSDYGREYRIADGICDLRPFTLFAGSESGKWMEGQREYERFQTALKSSRQDYEAQLAAAKLVYADIPITGRCLDVGGSDGRLRAFVAPGQDYLSIDPFFIDGMVQTSPELIKTYPFMTERMNFICGLAEHLPLESMSFDTVHMRSVIDHFLNPELALREAFRVLRPGGSLIIGLLVVGGRTGKAKLNAASLKELVRPMLVGVGLKRYADHHIWHPTYENLCTLISGCGFSVKRTHWQTDEVCYILGTRL